MNEPICDEKAGWCVNCRGGSHALCVAPGCACPRRAHSNRQALLRPLRGQR